MNNAKLIFDVCYLLIVCGGLGALGNWLSRNSKNKHFADGLIHAQTIASQLVAKYAMDPTIAEGQIKDAVTHDLQVILDQHGYHFSAKYLVAVAIKEIQHYENNGGSFKVQPTLPPKESMEHVSNKLTNNSNDNANQPLTHDQVEAVLDKNRQTKINELKNKGLVK